MKSKIASTVLMIQPVRFGYNEQTAVTNSFQNKASTLTSSEIQESALKEFHHFVQSLKDVGIEVIVFQDTIVSHTPDSIFPNNWLSTSSTGELYTFPMATPNRSLERRQDILDFLVEKYGYGCNRELEIFESQNLYLEGTGSLLIDAASEAAFVALSPRADEVVLEAYSKFSGQEIITFQSLGPEGELIYHTNVMLCIADQYAVIGADTIVEKDKIRVCEALKKRGKTLIYISNEQVYKHFAGNMLQLQNKKGDKFLVMSTKARNSLTQVQLDQIESFENTIVDVPLDVIETIGGGSARCMLAEIF